MFYFVFIILSECTRMLRLYVKITTKIFWGRKPPDPPTGVWLTNFQPHLTLHSPAATGIMVLLTALLFPVTSNWIWNLTDLTIAWGRVTYHGKPIRGRVVVYTNSKACIVWQAFLHCQAGSVAAWHARQFHCLISSCLCKTEGTGEGGATQRLDVFRIILILHNVFIFLWMKRGC